MTHEKNMIDYLDKAEDECTWRFPTAVLERIFRKKNFLKSPPKLGDFVPCTKDGEVYDPKVVASYNLDHNMGSGIQDKFRTEYQSALDRLIWNGWEYDKLSQELKNGHVKIWWKDAMIGVYNSVSGITQIVNSNYNELISSGVKLERIQRK